MSIYIRTFLCLFCTFNSILAEARVDFTELLDQNIQKQRIISKDIELSVQPIRLDEQDSKMIKIVHDIVRQKTTMKIYKIDKNKKLESSLIEKPSKVAATPGQE